MLYGDLSGRAAASFVGSDPFLLGPDGAALSNRAWNAEERG